MNLIKACNRFLMRMAESYILKSVRDGLMYSFPIFQIGSFTVLILNLPISHFKTIMNNLLGDIWVQILTLVINGTFDIMSILIFISISYSLVKNSKTIKQNNMDYILPVIVSSGIYFIITRGADGVIISASLAASTGLFLSMLMSICITCTFIFACKLRLFKLKRIFFDGEMALSQSMRTLEPAVWTFLIFSTLKFIWLEANAGIVFNYIYQGIVSSSNNSNNKAGLAYLITLLTQSLWAVGIHGTNVLDSLTKDVFSNPNTAGLIASGTKITLNDVFTKELFDVFVYLGGSGSTICLIAAMLFKKRSRSTRKIALASILPGIFNINEILLFGFPVVFNPYFIIPFILTPIVLLTITVFAMYFRFVPLPTVPVQWTAPIFLGGYVSTGNSFSGILLQAVNLCVGILIYTPFIDSYEKYIIEHNKEVLKQLNQEINNVITTRNNFIIDRKDEIGFLARSLVRDIYRAFKYNENPMHMVYQPQHDNTGKIVGCESLLRWNHEKYGFIPPPTIITLADEARMSEELGEWIIKSSFNQLSIWNQVGIKDVTMSVNLLSSQLKSHSLTNLTDYMIDSLKINPKDIGYEITENATVDLSEETRYVLEYIKNKGIKLSIDDFGMGHSSLLYIKNFFINTIKLDGSLVHDIVDDNKTQEIVNSITNLCQMLDLKIMAECVETLEQKEKLAEMGCRLYQGYYYSKPITTDEFVKYYNSNLACADKD